MASDVPETAVSGPSLPIPNDDPSCHCRLEPDGIPDGAVMVTAASPGGAEVRVALHADCPHHGQIVRQYTAEILRRVSVAAP